MGPVRTSGMSKKPEIKVMAGPVKIRARFTIELFSNGKINISAPSDRLVAYGMLGMAQEILIAMHSGGATKSGLVTPIM